MAATFQILGTGAGPGVPSYFCDCIACREAEGNPRMARTRSGAVVHTGNETILIDASPDLRNQLLKERINSLDYVFISHWHYDHFGGLGDLEFYVRLKRRKPLALFLPSEALEKFDSAFPFLQDVFEIQPWQFEKNYHFQNLSMTPLPAAHSIQTAGFLLEGQKKLAYFTDTAGLPALTEKKLNGVDYFICDATFHGENWYPHSHMSVQEGIQLGQQLQARSTILTHLSMHYSEPVTVEQLTKFMDRYPNASLAYDGMVIDL